MAQQLRMYTALAEDLSLASSHVAQLNTTWESSLSGHCKYVYILPLLTYT